MIKQICKLEAKINKFIDKKEYNYYALAPSQFGLRNPEDTPFSSMTKAIIIAKAKGSSPYRNTAETNRGTGYAESGDVRLAGPYSYTSGSSTSYAWISEDIDPESFDPASHPGEGEPWHLFLLGDQPSEPTVVACSGGGSVYNIQAGSWSNKSPVLIRTFSDFNYRGGDVSVSNFSSRVVAVDTDVSLSVIYGEWSVTPSEYNGSPISIELVNGAWTPMCSGSQIGTSYQDTGQVVLDWPDGYAAIVMRATRTESYKLGDQSSKLLAPASVIGDINSVLDAINGEVI